MRLLLPARDGSNRSAATECLRRTWSARRRGVRGPRPRPGRAGAARRRRPSPRGRRPRARPRPAADRRRRGASPGRRGEARRRAPARSSASTMVPDSVSSSARVPCAWIRPPPMIIIRSATASTSASRCEESSTVPPRSAKSRSRPRIQRMPSGSRPLAGSSRIRTSGSPSSAWAKPEALAHAERVLADPPPGRRLVEADELQQRVDALRRHAHGLGGDGERLAAAAPGVLGGRVEQDADAPAGVRQVAVAPAEDPGLAAVGLGEADEHPHRGGLAGAVGAEEARDGARLAAEGDVRDDGAPAELLGESVGFDHAGRLAARRVCNHGPRATLAEPCGGGRQRLW